MIMSKILQHVLRYCFPYLLIESISDIWLLISCCSDASTGFQPRLFAGIWWYFLQKWINCSLNLWATFEQPSTACHVKMFFFLPRFAFLCICLLGGASRQHVRLLCVLVAEGGICVGSIQAQINYRPNFSAFFQINPNRWERRHEKRHCCVADVMCSGSFSQPLLGWRALSFRKPIAQPFPSAWPSNCRGSPNNGIPLLLDANTQCLLDAGLWDVCCDHFDRWENTYTTHGAEDGLRVFPSFHFWASLCVYSSQTWCGGDHAQHCSSPLWCGCKTREPCAVVLQGRRQPSGQPGVAPEWPASADVKGWWTDAAHNVARGQSLFPQCGRRSERSITRGCLHLRRTQRRWNGGQPQCIAAHRR